MHRRWFFGGQRPDRVRRRLGFMPDYFTTYANMNVEECLTSSPAATLRPAAASSGGPVMEFTDWTLAEKPINGLSKGMKQRLCLGRRIHDPAVLVLDEPAAGLDPRVGSSSAR